MTREKPVQKSILLPASLVARITRLSHRENRSFSNMTSELLRVGVSVRERQGDRAPVVNERKHQHE